ncbi:helix-turn-helix domain-containing protein [Streptomyces sp. NPDC020996]|uniref:helix-turn-helix domain-containing protein n=1 Tax=Streptomyces sp. NPDC020996 TaxID=3154791 RepID=UPI0033D74267
MSTNDLGPEAALAELRRQLEDKRNSMGLSRTQLAQKANVSRGTVNNIVAGPVPREETVTLLAEALGLDPGRLLALRAIALGQAPAPVGPRIPGQPGDRLLALFQAGSAIGIAVTLQTTEAGRFEEFLGALRVIGLEKSETAPLREIRTRLEQADEPDPTILPLLSHVLDEVIDLVNERTPRAEFRWFELGKLLQGIAFYAAAAWPSAPNVEGARTELFYLSDTVHMPEELRNEVKGYCRTKLPTAARMEMFEEAERLSRAFHAIL